jgi:hypothetical protein
VWAVVGIATNAVAPLLALTSLGIMVLLMG